MRAIGRARKCAGGDFLSMAEAIRGTVDQRGGHAIAKFAEFLLLSRCVGGVRAQGRRTAVRFASLAHQPAKSRRPRWQPRTSQHVTQRVTQENAIISAKPLFLRQIGCVFGGGDPAHLHHRCLISGTQVWFGWRL